MSRLSSLVIASVLGTFSLPAGHAAVLTKGVPTRIMPLGDSITEGKFYPAGGYRVILQQKLKALGYSVQFVGKEDNGEPGNDTGFSQGMTNPNHEGYGSIRIDEIDGGGSEEGHDAPPIAQTLANDRPDVILMMLGTNDVLQQHDLEGLLGRLDGLVGHVFSTRKTVTLVIASLTPLSDRSRDAVAQAYNSGIPLIVAKYKARGVRVVFADMHGALDPSDLYDGIHPTASGFQKMADVWVTALTGIAPTVVPATPPAPRVKGAALSFDTAAPDPSKSAYSLGFRFKVGPGGLNVRALGYLNDGATGWQAVHIVGLYDDETHQLVTPAVPVTTSGGDLSGRNATFTYVSLPGGVRLSPNKTYDIVGTTAGIGFLKAPTGAAFDPGIVAGSVKSVFAAASPLTSPDSVFAANDPANVGPNFLTGTP